MITVFNSGSCDYGGSNGCGCGCDVSDGCGYYCFGGCVFFSLFHAFTKV